MHAGLSSYKTLVMVIMQSDVAAFAAVLLLHLWICHIFIVLEDRDVNPVSV